MSVSEPGKIITPWAESGLKNTIPPAANPATGRAGFDQGFSAINMTAKEAGGIPPFGQDFNGIFYEVTNILRYMQAGGQPTFDAALATAIGGYPKGAMVLGSDGVTLWQSKVDSNSTDPNTDPSNWGTFDIGLKADLSAPDGSDIVGFEQAGAGAVARTSQDKMRDVISIMDFGAKPGITNSAVTTAAFQAAYVAAAGKTLLIPFYDFYIDETILAGYSRTTTLAFGSRLFSTFDGLMFNLNQDANPSAIDGANSKAYINWFGGTFQCALPNPANAVAMRVYGVRQANIENCIFGHSGEKRLNAGIQIAGLGGHIINKNRFLLVDNCIDCPRWATDPADVAGHITTSSFIGNNFVLDPGQKAFWVRGGWNRWIIQGGFVNGSGVPTHHFTNFGDCKGLNVIGVGFEQAVAGGKFLYIQDTSGLSASSINIAGSVFNGDPPGGGHVAIELERCINVSIGDGTRVEGSTGRGNASVKCDANCLDVVIDPSCRLPDPGVVIAMPRREIAMGKTFQRISELVLPGYNGNSFSSGTVTLDMKTLMGFSYPRQLAPLAYDLVIQARDSGSAASTTVQLEVTKSLGGTTSSSILNLRGLPNDQRMGGNFHINAEADGSIALRFTASGAGTMDVWVYVVGVYN